MSSVFDILKVKRPRWFLLSAAALKLGMFMTSGACFTKHLKP